ncbi:type II secretion system protein [Clostridium sartagoforme]|uniref:Type II secretion system protein n=1 Tax=Clostridium sartagoforme TaxID=84031 RepID=A0A4S2DPL1_9CLOT|nr:MULTISPECIES: type II secretion system protein [Clostridium]MBS5938938.1 type II secretion system protein [Clostridium sp.]TGY44356.1 type II secretion system protein [Clostridium sartagoforme]
MKKGNTLVEVIISLAIILMAFTIVSQIIIISAKAVNNRKLREEAERVAYAIENEAKYNYKFSDLDEEISFKYTNDILDKLITQPLMSLERGNDISLKRKEIKLKDKIYLYSITIKDNNGGVLAEREFIKSYWMEKK